MEIWIIMKHKTGTTGWDIAETPGIFTNEKYAKRIAKEYEGYSDGWTYKAVKFVETK